MLGSLFEGQALRDLLVEAIATARTPWSARRCSKLWTTPWTRTRSNRLVEERKLTSEGMNTTSIRAHPGSDGTRGGARLQHTLHPLVLRGGLRALGGRMVRREAGRYEITACARAARRDRLIGRGDPVLERYERVTFDKTYIPGRPRRRSSPRTPAPRRHGRSCSRNGSGT